MKKYVNRRTNEYKNYSEKNVSNYSSLDIIAITLLRIAWSRNRDIFNTQNAVNYDCVAVCLVNGELWLASNNIKITDEDINVLLECMNNDGLPYNGNVWTVTNGSGHMHAEMQLVSQLKQENLMTDFIGVSKPCCKQCAEVLDHVHIGYSMWHDSPVVNWENPLL